MHTSLALSNLRRGNPSNLLGSRSGVKSGSLPIPAPRRAPMTSLLAIGRWLGLIPPGDQPLGFRFRSVPHPDGTLYHTRSEWQSQALLLSPPQRQDARRVAPLSRYHRLGVSFPAVTGPLASASGPFQRSGNGGIRYARPRGSSNRGTRTAATTRDPLQHSFLSGVSWEIVGDLHRSEGLASTPQQGPSALQQILGRDGRVRVGDLGVVQVRPAFTDRPSGRPLARG